MRSLRLSANVLSPAFRDEPWNTSPGHQIEPLSRLNGIDLLHGVRWKELEELSQALRKLARQGPVGVRSTRFATMIRWLGVPLAESIRSFIVSEHSVTAA